MKRKSFIQMTLMLMAFVFTLTSCQDKDELRTVNVSEVRNLYEPADNKTINLQAAATASVYFEWEKSIADDNSVVYYDILFDKPDGDFAKPIYTLTADNKGTATGATVTHKMLNRIAALAGAESGKQATLKWMVVASRGMSKTASTLSRTLIITRLEGLESPPALFITGAATEGGTDLSGAQAFKALAGGNEFEIYTKLTTGKKYYFVDSKQTVSRTFSPEGSKLGENENGAEVSKDGVYKITVDFLSGGYTIRELQSIGIFNPDQNKVTNLFDYAGNGTWKLANFNVVFVEKGGWQEDRYKFIYTFADGVEGWGQVGSSDSRPNLTNTAYFNMKLVGNGQWDGVFKFPSDFFDASNLSKTRADVTIYMTADGPYTHKFVKVN